MEQDDLGSSHLENFYTDHLGSGRAGCPRDSFFHQEEAGTRDQGLQPSSGRSASTPVYMDAFCCHKKFIKVKGDISEPNHLG